MREYENNGEKSSNYINSTSTVRNGGFLQMEN